MTQVISNSGKHEIWDRGKYNEEITTGKDKNGGAFCKISWKNKFSEKQSQNQSKK